MIYTTNKLQTDNRRIVIFGAGKIGRSFIGQLFSRSGYEIVFVDINEKLINELCLKRQYNVVIKDNATENVLTVKNARGVCLYNSDKVVRELADADIASFSVGQQGMPATIPVIAKALVLRRASYGDIPIDFIIAENMRNSDQYIRTELAKYLPPDYPLDSLVGLVETSIGKMVPIMTWEEIEKDPLQVFAEPYNTLIVSRYGFKNTIPNIENLSPKENIKAWVDRKLFIHNLGHAASAYLGYMKHPEQTYISEVLDDPDIFKETRNTMLQSSNILMDMYPGEFSVKELEAHIDDLLIRFRNRALKDTVYRVGCDLFRKLGPEDRIVAPIKAAIAFNKSYDLILNVLFAAIAFKAKDWNGNYLPLDEAFFKQAKNGIAYIIKNVCKLDLSTISL